MALELVLVYELEPAVPFTVANGTGIEKGTLLEIQDPATAIKNSGATKDIIGVAAEEKIASDGTTKIGVYMRGIFIARAGGTITVGDTVGGENATNELIKATTSVVDAQCCGTALETAADGEDFLVLINVGVGGSPNS